MSEEELPEGWAETRLDDLNSPGAPICYGVLKPGAVTPNGVPMLRVKDVRNGRVDTSDLLMISKSLDEEFERSRLSGGDVVISVQGSVGRVAVVPSELAGANVSRTLARIRPIDDGLTAWTALALAAPPAQTAMGGMIGGSTRDSLNIRDLRELPICVPPLAEQRRIVEKVEALLAQVNAARTRLAKVPTILKRFRQSILSAACSGRLTEDWRRGNPGAGTGAMFLSSLQDARRQLFEARNDRPRRTAYVVPALRDVQDLPELPPEWTWSTAEQICDFITKGTTPAADKMTPKGGVPFIKIQHLTERGILNFEVAPVFIDKATHQSGPMRRSQIVPGDVLMNIVGPPLGQTAVVPDSYPEWNTNQAVAILRPIPGLSTKYLALMATCGSVLSWAISRAKATVGQFNLTLELVRALPIPLPGVDEQHEIVRRVDALFKLADTIEARVAVATARADKITQAILAKAFRGELVPTEAELARQESRDYEPASALLARIRTARAADEAASKPAHRPRAPAATPAPARAKPARKKTNGRTARSR
jgi:type I restriction enzyme S subunit